MTAAAEFVRSVCVQRAAGEVSAMVREVQADLLHLQGHAHSNGVVQKDHDDGRADAGPKDGDYHGIQLQCQLSSAIQCAAIEDTY